MGLSQTITVEGVASAGIPVGELERFVDTILSQGSGVHELVKVDVDKVRGGENLVRLSVELSSEPMLDFEPVGEDVPEEEPAA